MTNGQPNDDIDSRLTRLENVLNSHRESLGLPTSLANGKVIELEALQKALDTASEGLSKFTGVPRRKYSDLDALAQEIDRNAADMRAFLASREHYDPIFDYFLRREEGELDKE